MEGGALVDAVVVPHCGEGAQLDHDVRAELRRPLALARLQVGYGDPGGAGRVGSGHHQQAVGRTRTSPGRMTLLQLALDAPEAFAVVPHVEAVAARAFSSSVAYVSVHVLTDAHVAMY